MHNIWTIFQHVISLLSKMLEVNFVSKMYTIILYKRFYGFTSSSVATCRVQYHVWLVLQTVGFPFLLLVLLSPGCHFFPAVRKRYAVLLQFTGGARDAASVPAEGCAGLGSLPCGYCAHSYIHWSFVLFLWLIFRWHWFIVCLLVSFINY